MKAKGYTVWSSTSRHEAERENLGSYCSFIETLAVSTQIQAAKVSQVLRLYVPVRVLTCCDQQPQNCPGMFVLNSVKIPKILLPISLQERNGNDNIKMLLKASPISGLTFEVKVHFETTMDEMAALRPAIFPNGPLIPWKWFTH